MSVGDTYQTAVLGTTPVAYWQFAGNLLDSVGVRHATIAVGTEAYVGALPTDSNAAFNCALMNYAQVPHHVSLKPAIGSIMTWFRAASLHTGNVVAVNTAGLTNPADFALRVNSTGAVTIFFQAAGANPQLQAPAYYTVGQVVCVIVTFGTAGFDLYLDGNHIGTHPDHTIGLTGNTLRWLFGAQEPASEGGAQIFDGVIDEIAIWNRILTLPEIFTLAQLVPPDPLP